MSNRVWQGMLMAALAAGCVKAPPPPELEEARATYKRVSAGPAAQQNPSGLADAKVTLDQAEKSYDDNGDNYQTRDTAYVATRKAQLAEAEANAALAAKDKARLQKELEVAQSQRQERLRVSDAAQALSAVGTVTEGERGTVLMLGGNILFASGQYNLREDSLSKLNVVAVTLKGMTGKTFLVEGYTDSTGKAAFNKKLAMKRAGAVREYLIRQGLPPEQVKAVGYGEDKPVAPNDTAEGRAQNRRVEIVVQPNPS
ncbi:MAG TPA: OmpA family protein [Myxococcaceae bacterium]|nr:OmpA family protein [Myxococcaceae bacterium]